MSENEKMVTIIAEKGFLTLEDLKSSLGLSKRQIDRRKKEGRIKYLGENRYVPGFIEPLFKKGLALFKAGNVEESEKYIRACYALNPDSTRFNQFMVYFDIKNGKYDNLARYFDVLLKEGYESVYRSTTLYLYLISFLTSLPEPYGSMIRNINKQDLIIDRNKVSSFIANQSFVNARIALKDSEWTINSALLELLLKKCEQQQISFRTIIYNSILRGKFDYTIAVLGNERQRHPLTTYYEMMRSILIEIEKMKRLRMTSPIHEALNESLPELIEKKNYKRARDKIRGNRTFINKNSQNGQMFLKLLDYAIEYSDEILYQELFGENCDNADDTLKRLLAALRDSWHNETEFYLSKYLKDNGLEDYDYLIEALIEICQKTKETSFEEPMTTLATLKNDPSNLNIAKYIRVYQSCRADGLQEIADIYITMILEATKRGHVELSDEDFEIILNSGSTEPEKPHLIEPKKEQE